MWCWTRVTGRTCQKSSHLLIGGEQLLHLPPEGGVPGARGIEKRWPLRWRPVQGFLKKTVHLVPSFGVHRSSFPMDHAPFAGLVCNAL